MRKYLQRGLCFVLGIIMIFSCASIPAGAVDFGSFYEFTTSFIQEWFGADQMAKDLERMYNYFKGTSDDIGYHLAPLTCLDSVDTRFKMERSTLGQLSFDWNITCAKEIGFGVDLVDVTMKSGEVYTVAMCRSDSNRPQMALADGNGRIMYCDSTTELSGRWASEADTRGRHLLNYNDLFNLSQDVGGLLRIKDGFYEIYKRDGTLYCNVAGRRFSSIYKADQTAINQDRPTTGGTVIEGDTVTNIENNDNSVTNNDYSQDIDIEDMTQVLPGGIQNVIDNLIYDDNTKTYYIDSHDTTNNVTNNYLYQYHINYTSITYIGQSEEYNKRYELYYQLPDGRDSADLTREELEQLNVDIDVIPYVRSTDNVDVRSLYHFDGDTRDSSYWNYITEFEWITGASLTYMESGAFEGALYLDENQHAFRMTMPQATDTAGDWTLQWRYYQSHTEAPVNDSSVYVGDKSVLTMDGKALYTPAGDQIAVIPTGSWNEICIIRSGGQLYYYVNGVYYAAVDDVNSRFDDIRFVFGSEQQTYKYFDELRFSRGALYTPGENYTPTSVPHDSNLALILPTGKDVVVDEVAVYKPSENNLFNGTGWEDMVKNNPLPNSQRDTSPFYPETEYVKSVTVNDFEPVWTSPYPFIYDRDLITAYIMNNGKQFAFKGSSPVTKQSPEHSAYRQPWYSVAMPLFYLLYDGSDDRPYDVGECCTFGYKPGVVYTLSVVLSDCTYSSITFKIVKQTESTGWVDDPPYSVEILSVDQSSEIQFFLEDDLGLYQTGYGEDTDFAFPVTAICWNSLDRNCTVRALELVEGDGHQFVIEYDTAVYDETELTHSPTLAVRTDVIITDQQIGGVRPSVPEKGQVWALVESGYITSLQVYNGSVWLNCDGRIWTGHRWIPVSSYNVITLQDMFDMVDATQDYEYIYTESGFWGWLQKAWKDMIARFDRIIELIQENKSSPDVCQHVYDMQVDRKETCTEPGHYLYTCSNCGHTFTEYIDALGHDWLVTGRVEPTDLPFAIYKQPVSVTAPMATEIRFTVIATGDGLQYQWQMAPIDYDPLTFHWEDLKGAIFNYYVFSLSSWVPQYKWRCKITDSSGAVIYSDEVTATIGTESTSASGEARAAVDGGYDELTCSRCGLTTKDYGEGALDTDIFEAAGDLIAEGITWLLDKATELVNSLNGITEVFNRFVDRIRDLIGSFPLFFSAVVFLFPEDLTVVIWFGVIAFVVRAVWKKYNKS